MVIFDGRAHFVFHITIPTRYDIENFHFLNINANHWIQWVRNYMWEMEDSFISMVMVT